MHWIDLFAILRLYKTKKHLYARLIFLHKNVCAYRFEKGVFMEKSYWEKSCKYSIRKLTVGTASVLLGAVFLATQNVAADSLEVKDNQTNVSETTVQVDVKVEEPTQANTENQPSTDTQPSTELADKEVKPEIESPQTHHQSVAHGHEREGINLTCHDYLIEYYEKHGFINEGKSKSCFAGEEWYDMVWENKN